MTSRFFVTLSIVLISILWLLPVRMADACAYLPEDTDYSFVSPVMVDTASLYAPYFLRFDDFHFSFLAKDVQRNENIVEWIGRFCDEPLAEDVFQVIYKSPIEEIEEMRMAAINANLVLPINLRKNTFAEAIQEMGCVEVSDYIIFAKKCEPHVVSSGNAWEKKTIDTVAMHELMNEGGRLFKSTESHFVRLRIAFQVIRLAHYAGEYKKVLRLYDYFLPKIAKIESIIHWWILGHKAGAMQKLGQKVESAYLFAQIFQNSPSKRTSAFRSFKISTNKEWEQCLLLCESDIEKANLHALRAHQKKSRIVDEMELIYAISPKHPSIEPLLVRAIQQFEKTILGYEFKKGHAKKPTTSERNRLQALQTLVDNVILTGQAVNPNLWATARAYLHLIAGDWVEAEIAFEQLEVKDKQLQSQIDIMKVATKAMSLQDAGTQTESDAYNIMYEGELYKNSPHLKQFLDDRLAYLYRQSELPGKAFIRQYELSDLRTNPSLAILNDLIAVCEKEHITRLEKAMITKADGSTILSDLLEIKGTYFLGLGQIEMANETFGLIPRAERSAERYSPFAVDYRDCVHCPVTDTTAYTKAELTQKLVDLDYRARADIEDGPSYFFLLGLGWYNISYFGPAWEAADYYRSGASWHFAGPDEVYPLVGSPFGNKENKNLHKSRFYFSKALELSKDEELQAQAAFMLARIDQKEWMVSEDNSYDYSKNMIPKLPPKRMVYYNILMRDYADTEFYKEIIDECQFFAAYAR